MRVRLSPLARRDLDEIWDYTADHWGVDRANDYVANLRKTAEALASTASLSADASYLGEGLRKARSGAHLIYFQLTDEIDVVRILHERRDASELI